MNWAKAQGFDQIATGHYAKRVDKDGMTYLYKSFDQNKDQTYFLSQLNQSQLQASIFPLGDIDKHEVRAIANELNPCGCEQKGFNRRLLYWGTAFLKSFYLTTYQ